MGVGRDWAADAAGRPKPAARGLQHAASKLVYDYISGFQRQNDDGSTTLENGRLALFRNFDEHGNPLPRPNTLLIDSEQLESGEGLDDNFRSIAADEGMNEAVGASEWPRAGSPAGARRSHEEGAGRVRPQDRRPGRGDDRMAASTPNPENLAPLVRLVRGEKVLLDADLASLYGVESRVLNQAVARNRARFPSDFMFQLTAEEYENLRSQIVTASEAKRNSSQIVTSSHRGAALRSQVVISKGRGGRQYRPYAFTEQGIAMLSSVLRSPRAVEVNIAIMRTFVQLRRLMDSNRDLARKIEAMESKYDEQFAVVFDAIKKLIAEDDARKTQPKRRIGFAS